MAHSVKAGRSVPPKILNVLQVIRAGRGRTVPDIAGLTGIPKPVLDRWTRRLADWRVLEPTRGGTYRAGLALRLTGDGALADTPGFLPELSGVMRGRVRLGVLHPGGVSFVEQRPIAGAPLAAAGTRSAQTGALGLALLAFRPEHSLAARPAEQRQADAHSLEKLAHAIALTRLSGVAITRRRTRGNGFRVAVPVANAAGAAALAIEVTIRELGDGFPSLYEAMVGAASRVSGVLTRWETESNDDSSAPACSN